MAKKNVKVNATEEIVNTGKKKQEDNYANPEFTWKRKVCRKKKH